MSAMIKFVLGGQANPSETEPIAAQPPGSFRARSRDATVPTGWVMIEATKAVAAGKPLPAVHHGPEHQIHIADSLTIEYEAVEYRATELAITEDGTFRYLIQEPRCMTIVGARPASISREAVLWSR
jgi:hypothetical protein